MIYRIMTIVFLLSLLSVNAYSHKLGDCEYAANLRNPEVLGSYDTPGYALSVAVAGNTAYVADGDSGLLIIDVSDPHNPQLLGSFNTPGYALTVTHVNNVAYIADGDSGLQIIDVSTSQNPQYLGSFDTPGYALSVMILGNIAYIADGEAGLQIIDITNSNNPQLIGTCDLLGNASSIIVAGNYAYIANFDLGLQVIQVSDPANPQLWSSYDTSGQAQSVSVMDSLAYIADGDTGLQIINIADPDTLSLVQNIQLLETTRTYIHNNLLFVSNGGLNEIGIYDLSINSQPTVVFNYAWDLNTYGMCLDNGKLYTANGLQGLSILDYYAVVPINDLVAVPKEEIVLTSYPNPFNPSTTISFDLPNAGFVSLNIYNIRGQKVKSLVNSNIPQGNHTILWNGIDDNGHSVASGVYFARISSGGKNINRKLVLVK